MKGGSLLHGIVAYAIVLATVLYAVVVAWRAKTAYASGWRPQTFDHLFVLGAWVFVIGLGCKLTGLGWPGLQYHLADVGIVPLVALLLFRVTHRDLQKQSRHLTNLEWTKVNVALGKKRQKMIFLAFGLAIEYEIVTGVLFEYQHAANLLSVGPFDVTDLACYAVGAAYALAVSHLWMREQRRVLAAQLALRPAKD
jgi:hypothetical protein